MAWVDSFFRSSWWPSWQAARSLWFDYGHLRSVLRRSSVDGEGNPVPWYTYPAIEYLRQLDFSAWSVFEYGSGNSTLYWGSVAARVVSVEDDEGWYRKLSTQTPSNCELVYEPDLDAYAGLIQRYAQGFDIIVIDGAARGGTRLRCAKHAIQKLRRGGMIILDNSDWLPESARMLREADLIQVDMTGFGPILGHSQTTSFFLHRDFRPPPRERRQPLPGPGGVPNVWEYPQPDDTALTYVGGEWFGGIQRRQPFTIESPTGPRRFTIIVARVSICGACTAIVDVDRERVLISLTEPSGRLRSAETELEPVTRMSWVDFTCFINAHDKKRYVL